MEIKIVTRVYKIGKASCLPDSICSMHTSAGVRRVGLHLLGEEVHEEISSNAA